MWNVREGGPEDLEALLELARTKVYYRSHLLERGELQELTEGMLKYLVGSDASVRVLLADDDGEVGGYFLLKTGEVESITREPQTLIADYGLVEPDCFEALLDRADEIGRQVGDRYLVVHTLYLSEPEEWFCLAGFTAEISRTVKRIEPGARAPQHPRFPVRRARPNDQMFIMWLNTQCSPVYLPAGREVDRLKISQGFLESYAELKIGDPNHLYFIADDQKSGDPVGFLILQLGRLTVGRKDLTAYVYDIAAHPDFRGNGISYYLLGNGEQALGEAGGGYLIGDISMGNPIAIKTSESLGFHQDSRRWGRPLTSRQHELT
ncbi:MAG: N-acetyltransferase family protein [Vulcanimicrobiota bacterium]